ncbi:hypothetical protein KBC55_03730 [Patescibacteria group bacterium]|nr:hypothetical protein [Patescibacteria group bacterium]
MRTQLFGLLKAPLALFLAIADFDSTAFVGIVDNTKIKRIAVKDVDGVLDIVIDTVNGPMKDGYLELDKVQVVDTDNGKFYMILGQTGFKELLEKEGFKDQLGKFLEATMKNTDDVVTFGYADDTYTKVAFGILAANDNDTYVVTEKTAIVDFQKLDDRIVAKLTDDTTGYIDANEVMNAFMDADYVHIGACMPLENGDKFARVKKGDMSIAAYTRNDKLFFIDRDDASQLDGNPIDLKSPDMKNLGLFMNKDGTFIVGQTGECDFAYSRFDGSIEQISA